MNRFVLGVAACCILLLGLPVHGSAEVVIKALITVEEMYSSNFYAAEEDEVPVFVTRVSPGLSIKAETDRSNLAFDYSLNAFWHYDDEDWVDTSEDDYVGHDLTLEAGYNLTQKFGIGISEEFFLTREPGASDRFSESTTRDKYWRNRVMPYMNYDIAEKGQIRLGYRNEVLEYLDSDSAATNDSVEHRGLLTLTFNLNTQSHLDLDAQVWYRTYDDEAGVSDYYSYQGELVFRHEFNTWLKGEVGAGFHWRDFDEDRLEDWKEAIFHGALTGESDKTKLEIGFERNLNDFALSDQYYTSYRIDAFVRHQFTEVFWGEAGGYYQFSEYEQSTREDNIYNIFAGVGVTLLSDILRIGLRYSYTSRDSNETGLDYDEHQVFLAITATYDTSPK